MNGTQKPIGVLLLLHHLDLGGGARRIKVYSDLLNREKFTPVVVIRDPNTSRSVDAVIGSQTPRLFSKEPLRILEFVAKNKILVLYFWYDGQFDPELHNVLTKLKEKGVRIVANNVFSYYDQRMDELCDVVVFQTKFMLYKFLEASKLNLNFKKYVVLPNPIYSDYYKQFMLTRHDRNELKASLGFFKKDIVVGRFGRNDIVKWGDLLLQTMFVLRTKSHIKFLVVGMPRSRRWLIRVAGVFNQSIRKNIKIIKPTADDKELFELMQVCDLIGHSVKIGEGCSNAINECLYWGKPVITNPTPHCDNGQVEQVEHLRNGIVARGVREWVGWIQRLSNRNTFRKKLGNQAKKSINRTIAAPLVTREFEQILLSALEKKRRKTAITVTNKEFRDFVKQYESNSRLSASVLPTKLTDRSMDFVIRAMAWIEFRWFNG